MNNVYILLELAKLDSEVYNLLMRASKPFNAFINSNTGLRATIRDSFLTRREYFGPPLWHALLVVFTFKGQRHRLDGPAKVMTVHRGSGSMEAPNNQRILFTAGQTGSAWWERDQCTRAEITDSQNEPTG